MNVTSDPRSAVRVFYDGACPLCHREIGWYQGRIGADQIDWVNVSSSEPEWMPAGLTREDLMLRFTVERRDGVTARGAAGFVAVWRALPGTARLARLADNRVVVGIGEIMYRAMLKVRPLWQPKRGEA